jgi:hypothetical protein
MLLNIKLFFLKFLIAFLKQIKSEFGEKGASMSFESDSNVQKVATTYADDCVNWVKENSTGSIEYQDRNIIAIEGFLDDLSKYYQKNTMPLERLDTFSKMFGFYIGEVYRRNHAGVNWGYLTINGNKQYALGRKASSGAHFCPITKVKKRVMEGPEENVLVYYRALVENKI